MGDAPAPPAAGGGDGGGGDAWVAPPAYLLVPAEQDIMNAVGAVPGAENPFQNPAVIVADWLGFIILGGSSIILCYKLMGFYGSDNKQKYFIGYREEKMLSVYVNTFAAVVYWARVSAHANGDVGLAAYVHLLKYCDYCFTCPLLTLDLMWSLNLPYKFTYSIWVGICIFSGIGSTKFQPPAKYMWFAFGMVIMFIVFWHIYSVVIIRLNQIFCGSTKKSANTLQIACAVYFSIWWGFPVLWFLLEFGVIGHPVTLCMHTVLDVSAKSFYGFMLLSFQLQAEREEWIFLPLQPKIAWNENASETESQADVELGYNSEYGFTGGSKQKEHITVGSSKQRKESKIMMEHASMMHTGMAHSNVPYAGQGGLYPAPNTGGYVNDRNSPMINVNLGGQQPGGMPGGMSPHGQNEEDMVNQIRALNMQLNDMMATNGNQQGTHTPRHV